MIPRPVLNLVTTVLITGGLIISAALVPIDTMAQNTRIDNPAQTKTGGEMLPSQGWIWDLFGSGPVRRDERSSGGKRDEPATEPGDQRLEGREEGGRWRQHGSRNSETYRTLCVRICDGFYWPISHRTTRDRFSRDAKRCEQACPTRSRLFVHHNPGEEPATMVDLEGRPYRQLENAFRHQTEYIADCTCRGNPWDEEALARHRAYAEASQVDKNKAAAGSKKLRIEQEASRREHRTSRSQQWVGSGLRGRDSKDDQ